MENLAIKFIFWNTDEILRCFKGFINEFDFISTYWKEGPAFKDTLSVNVLVFKKEQWQKYSV